MYVLCATMVCMCVCAQALFVWLLYVCTYVCDMSSCVVVQFVCCMCLYVCIYTTQFVLYVFVCMYTCVLGV